MKTILIAGGHLTPALAVIEKLPKNWRVVYVGRKHALEGDQAMSQEYRIITKLQIPFLPINTGRLQRTFSLQALVSLFKIPLGFIYALFYVLQQRPHVILSFGGYVAVPVVVVGWCLRIPIVTHEQTLAPGLANRIIAKFTKKICISWPDTEIFFPKEKVILTGNPLRSEIFSINKKLELPAGKPLLYISGGNLGSHSLNIIIEKTLPDLLMKYSVIHQVGNAQEYKDFEKLEKVRSQLSIELQKRYLVRQYIDSEYIGWVYTHTDVMITRSGANTVSEIIALTKPAIFIPLPWAGENEQLKNAQYLSQNGAALLIEQSNLSPKVLLDAIAQTVQQEANIIANLKKINESYPYGAAEKIIQVIESVA